MEAQHSDIDAPASAWRHFHGEVRIAGVGDGFGLLAASRIAPIRARQFADSYNREIGMARAISRLIARCITVLFPYRSDRWKVPC